MPAMLTLGVDTTTMWGSLGLWQEGPLGETGCRRLARGDDPLLPSLEFLLTSIQAGKSALELIAVSLGPGSFTSLRVGVSLAKGLALGLNLPLVGVPSLPVYAQQARGWPGTVCALTSDRKDRAYVACYEDGQAQGDSVVMELDDLQTCLKTARPPVLMVGPGAARLYESLTETASIWLASTSVCQPSGLAVATMGLEKFKRQGADDLATLEPLYGAAPAIDPAVIKQRGD